MPPLVYLGLANAACAAVLALLAVLVGRCFRRPALTHALWLLVLIKLVTPPVFSLPLAWLPASSEVIPPAPAPAPVVVVSDQEPDVTGPPTPADVWIEMEKGRAPGALIPERVAAVSAPEKQAESGVPVPLPGPAARPAVPVSPAPTLAEIATLAGIVWLVGSVLWFVRSVARLARFQRLLRHASQAPGPVRELAGRLARQLGLRRCPAVLLLPAPLPPMVWAALGRARVLLPAGLLERLDEEQLAALLAHELAHIRRADHWVRRLEFVALGLFWWYPLAWWARSRLQAEAEECCDAWVVAELPVRTYASAIVETIDFLAGELAPVPALASGLGRLAGLKRRLIQIYTGTTPKRLGTAGRLIVLGLALGLLPLLPALGRSEKKAGEPPAAAKETTPTEADEALAFRPNPLTLTGGDNEIAALAVSRDGRFLAAGTGSANRPGEVRVWTVPDHKDVLGYSTAGGVAAVAFSPDGRYLASSGYDNQAVVREFPSGKVVCVLPLDGPARLDFSPDGRTLVTATESKSVKLWNALTGAEIARLEGELFRWYCVAYSGDGKLVAAGGGDFNQKESAQVTIWDTTTFKQVGKLQGHTQPILGVAFAPDSQMIATSSADGTARLWRRDGFKELATLEGHENRVKSVAFTPDGKTLVTASHDGSVRLWDVKQRMPLTRLDGHVAPARSVVVSPDGKQLFSGGAQRLLKVWDLATHKETASYQPAPERPGETTLILAVAYSPDGKILATAHENGTISLRNAANGDLLRNLEGHEDATTCLVFTQDGKTLIAGSDDKMIRLWDVATGKKRELAGHTSWVYALALSPDGKTLASAGYDKLIKLWDLETLQEKKSLAGHKGAVRALAFAPDGKSLASGASDQTIKLWDLGTFKEKAALTGHEGTVRSLAFAPDGKMLVSGSEDATLRLWSDTGALRAVLKGHNNKVSAVAFSPHGRYVVSAGMDLTLRLWEASTGQALQTLRGHNDALTCLAWAPDGRFLVTAGYDRTVKLWVVTTGTLRLLTGHTGPVQSASFSPDGKMILSCSGWPAGDKTLRLWDAATGKEIRQFMGHTGPIVCAVFSPDGKRALSGSSDKTVRLWNVDTGQLIRVLNGHKGEVARVVFAPDGKRAASSSHDKTVRIWDLETGECLPVLSGHTDFVRALAFTPDGKHLISGARDATLRIWDVARGVQTQLLRLPKGWIDSLALSPDGKRVAAGNGTAVRIMDLETGKEVRQFDGHPFGVNGVAWSPDGKSVLSGGYDGTARLWEVATGRQLHVFGGHRDWVWTVNFSPDGRRIVTAGGGGRNGNDYVPGSDFAIRIWPLPDTSLRAGRVIKASGGR